MKLRHTIVAGMLGIGMLLGAGAANAASPVSTTASVEHSQVQQIRDHRGHGERRDWRKRHRHEQRRHWRSHHRHHRGPHWYAERHHRHGYWRHHHRRHHYR